MTGRSYTVKEVDELRSVIERKWLFGTYGWDEEAMQCSRCYKEGEKTVAVEEMVRTHMLAGHTAEDLIASEVGA